MYHISKDSRAERSARQIVKGLDECLKQKSFANITVSEIQRAAGVSRSTFYRLFDNPADILSLLCDTVIAEGARRLEHLESFDGKSILLIQIELWRKHRKVLEIIVNSGRLDLIYQSNMKYHQKYRQILMEHYGLDQSEEKYQRTIMTAIEATILRLILDEDESATSQEIQEKIFGSLRRMFEFFIGSEM